MFTSQIVKALSSDEYAGKNFAGVYPSDRLPTKIDKYPSSVVVNTDPARKPGTHWVAFYFDSVRHLDYFDSYGAPPNTYPGLDEFASNNSSTVSWNGRQLQGFGTDVCGQYCIAFVAMRSRGFSLAYIVDYYSSNGESEPGAHDEKVRSQVNRFYNIKRVGSNRNRRTAGRGSEQCCCAASCQKD